MITHSAAHYTLLCESEYWKSIFLNALKHTFPISEKFLSWQQTAIHVGNGVKLGCGVEPKGI